MTRYARGRGFQAHDHLMGELLDALMTAPVGHGDRVTPRGIRDQGDGSAAGPFKDLTDTWATA